MSNLAPVNQTPQSQPPMVLAPSPMLSWLQNQEKRELCKRTYCKGASDDEFELFLLTAANSGLDPFKRQIFLVPRWDAKLQRMVFAPQTSIDGFRVIAERTGKYQGQLGPFWCGADGKWVEVWLSKTPPAAAKVGVIRTDFKEPLWAVARLDAYAQTNKEGRLNAMWAKMADLMLSKCAESLAIRKAFPDQLSGLYTQEEMGQAEVDVTPPSQEPKANPRPQVNARKLTPKHADFVIPTKQYANKKTRLKDIDAHELDAHINEVFKWHMDNNKQLSPDLDSFMSKAQEYLESVGFYQRDQVDA